MDFSQGRKEYLVLMQKVRSGRMPQEAFWQELGKLRVQDDKGTWWQIREDGAGWLFWDGKAWQPGKAPRDKPAEQRRQTLHSLGSLFLLIVKGMWQSIVSKWKLFLVALVIVWGLNVFLMYAGQIPFLYSFNRFLASTLGVGANPLPRVILWMTVALFIFSLIDKVRKAKQTGLLREIGQIPGMILRSFVKLNLCAWAFTLLWAVLALLLCQVMNIRLTALLLVLLFLISLSDQEASFIFLLSSLAWSDLRRLLGMQPEKIDFFAVYRMLAALAAGSLAYYLFSFIYIYLGYFVALAFIVIAVVFFLIRRKPAAAA